MLNLKPLEKGSRQAIVNQLKMNADPLPQPDEKRCAASPESPDLQRIG
jgi:hypothetical protein